MKPKLDYYIGRPVEAVESVDEDWNWRIELSGGILIKNEDKRRTSAPMEIVHKSFLVAVLSETDTTLQFGHYENGDPVIDTEVALTPTLYTISDERFGGGPHYPQKSDTEEEDLLPEDPSAERVVDGPETPAEGTEDEE